MREHIDMKAYGLTDRWAALAKEYDGLGIARVLSQEKGLFCIVGEDGEKWAKISGKFRFRAQCASELPAAGDFVMADWNETGGTAVLHQVLPRVSCFSRKAAGSREKEQVVAANLDTVFLCMALNGDFNLRCLERYLSIGWDSGATPVVVLTKADLCENLEACFAQVQETAFGVDILVTTAMEPQGCEELRAFCSEGKTVAFIGSSGVGKSTIINRLLGEERLETNGLRNDDKGRHTTTRRELFLLPEGGMVIDTPGMREFGMWDNESGVEKTFADVEALAERCRFRDCTHINEPSCAVRQALESGGLSEERWQSYQKLKTESAYTADKESYLLAKGKREKEISRLIKKLPVKK